MIFVLIFSALAVSLASLSGTNVQVASNEHRAKTALYAAQSGLECAKYIVSTASLGQTNLNYVTTEQANQVWTDLCQYMQSQALDGKTVPSATRFTDAAGQGDQITTPTMDFGSTNVDFSIRFYRYDSDPRTIKLQSVGNNDVTTRRVAVDMAVTKDREVLTYAIAGRGRMWLTGDTTIHGDLFSTWNNRYVSPFNTTSETSVLGTINTVIEKDNLNSYYYDMETLDSDGNPLFAFGQSVYDSEGNALSGTYGTVDENNYLTDTDGNPVYDESGTRITVDFENRVYSSSDELQGYHENVTYYDPSLHTADMAGLDISDYDTSVYTDGLTEIASSSTTTREYFPHASGNYNVASSSSSRRLDRHVYENQTFTNALLPSNRNALFRNCTFEEVLYVDCAQSASSYYNNVRFEDCTFNGVIVTDTPQSLKWQYNALYFTGAATFNNTSSIQEATILAPHFNVDLGNTNPEQSDNNVLTGAIVGGSSTFAAMPRSMGPSSPCVIRANGRPVS